MYYRMLRRPLVLFLNMILVKASVLLIYRFVVLSFESLFPCNFFVLLSLHPFAINVLEVIEIILIS